MSNVSRAKKVLAIVLAVTCMMVFSFGTVFATETTASPSKGEQTTKYGNEYVYDKTTKEAYHYGLTAELKKKTTVYVNNTVTKEGVTYKVVGIKAYAFKGSKAKTIKLKGNVTKISKKAFYGSKVGKSKIVVKIKKSAYTAKQIKTLKKQLKAAGIKAKNIKFY